MSDDEMKDLRPDLECGGDIERDTLAQEYQTGAELFDDVVGDFEERQRRTPLKPSALRSVQLPDSVAGLYEMVKDLQVQLNQMVSINETTERDLEVARQSQVALEKERDRLRRKLGESKLDVQTSVELREELRHMTRENERLVEQLQDAKDKASDYEHQQMAMTEVLSRARMEREDLCEEIGCLESQLSQAAEHIATLRETKERQARRLAVTEQRLRMITNERDALRMESDESRAALDEIKRSLTETNIQSQFAYYES